MHAEIGFDWQTDPLVYRADPQPVLSVGKIVVSLRQSQEILLLRVLDPFQDLGISKEYARLLEREQMVVKILDDRFGVLPREIVNSDEVLDIVVTELQEILPPQQLLFGDFGVTAE
jgi:hypothetical protein